MPLTAKPSLHDNDALLTYRVGPVLCCGPTLPIVTITPPPEKLTHPPGTNIAEPGIFKHGSDIVSATDLRYRFGVKQENWKQPGQVIIAKHADLTRGYFVDEIIDVTHFPETGWGQLPAYLPRGVFSRTLVINKKIYLYAEFEKLSQLQGSGYLSDYIAHLEDQLEKENKIAANIPESKNKACRKEEKATPKISQPEIEPATPNQTKVEKVNTDDKLVSSTTPPEKEPLLTSKVAGKNIQSHQKEEVSESSRLQASKKLDCKNDIPLNRATNNTAHKKPAVKITKPLQNNSIKNQTNAETKTKDKTVPPVHNKAKPEENTNTINPSTPKKETEKNSNTFGFALILLMFILIAGGVYYYFSIHESQNGLAKSPGTVINEDSDNSSDTLHVNKNRLHEEITLAEKVEYPDSVNATSPTQIVAAPVQTTLPTTKPDTENDTPTEYRASINQDDTTITIELKGPLPPRVINTSPDVISGTGIPDLVEKKPVSQQALLKSNTKNTPDVSSGKKTQTTKPQKKTVKDNSIEIIHVIVKGDTLWAIAKHYLQNPFLYPELAKLSRIKNPDLIYPGNRVRIIYRAKNKTGHSKK